MKVVRHDMGEAGEERPGGEGLDRGKEGAAKRSILAEKDAAEVGEGVATGATMMVRVAGEATRGTTGAKEVEKASEKDGEWHERDKGAVRSSRKWVFLLPTCAKEAERGGGSASQMEPCTLVVFSNAPLIG
jgi:hypothetical protein